MYDLQEEGFVGKASPALLRGKGARIPGPTRRGIKIQIGHWDLTKGPPPATLHLFSVFVYN